MRLDGVVVAFIAARRILMQQCSVSMRLRIFTQR
jgi:hypothetical protein